MLVLSIHEFEISATEFEILLIQAKNSKKVVNTILD